MNWRKAGLIVMLFSVFGMCLPAAGAEAALSDKKVQLPDFPIEINGHRIDNERAKYPFFEYKDITYMPLTWDNIQALGLQLEFNAETGLTVSKGGGQRGGGWFGWKLPVFEQDLSGSNSPGRKYAAAMPRFEIVISDTYINNWEEKYPLLVWNDVTYLPLTWTYAYELLGLELTWDEAEGLGVIGNQQPVLDHIFFDDKEFLYIYPWVVTEPWQGVLKLRKTLQETPVWMTRKETDVLIERMESQREKLSSAGQTVELGRKDDGVYYEGIRLLDKDKIAVDSTQAGNPTLQGVYGTRYELSGKRTLVSVQVVVSIGAGYSQRTYYTFLVEDGKATELTDFRQQPDRVIANPDGSYWLASNGVAFLRGKIASGTLKLALLGADGTLKLANEAVDGADIFTLGTATAGLDDLLREDGKLLIYARSLQYDQAAGDDERTSRLYWIDTQFGLETAEDLDQATDLLDFIPFDQFQGKLYLGADRKLYVLEGRPNAVRNATDDIGGRWYDYELLETEG